MYNISINTFVGVDFMKKTTMKLPDAELDVMKIIWNYGFAISTTQVKEDFDKIRVLNISAIQTLLNRLIERGFISSFKQGKNRYYEIIVKESDYITKENKTFLNKLNGNSITRLVTNLYDSSAITDDDLIELAAFIEEKTKGC